MKKSVIFTLLSVALGLLYACEKPEQETGKDTPAEPPTLEINENLVKVSAAGGRYSFTYELTNEDRSELKAETGADWIHDFDLSQAGEVSFTADANGATESRIANITLKYGSRTSDKITVTQSGVGEGLIEYSFDISYEIDGPFVSMTVVPEPESTRYFAWYYSQKGMEEALAQSPGVTIEMYFRRLVEVELSNAIYYGSFAGYTPEQAVAELTLKGMSTQKFTLNGETGFYGYVCAVSNDGEVLSDVTYVSFETGPIPPSDNELSIVINDVNTDRISYSVQTTNQDQYAAMVFAAEDIEGTSDEELLEMYNGMDDITDFLHFGDWSSTILVGEEDADYYVVAFGYEYGMLTTDVLREKVHTLTSDPSAVPEFSINVDKVTHFRIKGSVSADPKTSLYYMDCCLADEDPEDLKKNIREAAMWFVDNGYYSNVAACYKAIGFKGTCQFEHTALSPQTGYRIYAIGINELTGEFSTDIVFSDIVTTPAEKVSSSYIDIRYDTYFDGYDLAEAYPSEFGDADGWAVIPLDIKVNGNVTDYYYDIYVGDVTDTTYPTDMELILDLEMYGNHNMPLTMSYCYFNETLTLVYFSIDDQDNKSPVVRKKFTLTPSGCSDVSEFEAAVPASATRSSRARTLKR